MGHLLGSLECDFRISAQYATAMRQKKTGALVQHVDLAQQPCETQWTVTIKSTRE